MTVTAPAIELDPDLRQAGDVAHFWRVPRYRGLDCLRATFRRHVYARHSHETYAVAAIVAGCETFYHRGIQHYAGAGSLAVVCPDEIHDGEPHGGGFVYRTFYPSAALMQEVAEEVAGRPLARPPWFPRSVMDDPALVAGLVRLHASLEDPRVPVLERDERLVAVLATLIARWSDLSAAPPPSRESRAVRIAREMLEGDFAREIGLDELADAARLSRTRLIRAFRDATGLTPHAYQVDRRFRAATRLLERGETPAAVAAACGFCDQSHLNRVFRARMGVTPGAYRRA